MARKGYVWGVVCGVLAAVCYGANPLGAVSLYRDGVGTEQVLLWRFAFAAVLLGAFLLFQGRFPLPSKRDLGITAVLGVLFAVSSQTFYASFRAMDIGVTCTVLFVYPIMVAAIMTLFFKEKLRWGTVASTLLALGGIAVLSLDGGAHRVTASGVGLVLVSALTYALYIVVVNRASPRLSAEGLTFWVLVFCLLGVAGWMACSEGIGAFRLPSGMVQWGYALFLAVVPTLLSLLFMVVSVARLGSTPTAILGALEPLTAVAIGVCVFGEAFTPRLVIGIGGVLAAVVLLLLTDGHRGVGHK